MTELETMRDEVRALMSRLHDGARDERAFDALASRIGAMQVARCDVHARLAARATRDGAARSEPVAVPTDVFRYADVSVLSGTPPLRTFRTSGTTSEAQGRHALRDLSLYEISARHAAKHFLFPDTDAMDLVSLVPDERVSPHSSLSYMVARFADWFCRDLRYVVGAGGLDHEALAAACERAESRARPVAILATSFALVHAEDALGDRRFRLPSGSRVMQTGGFKGRSREVSAEALRAAIVARYGVADAFVIGEYGMTELSSQLYETTLRHATIGDAPAGRAYGAMGWVRATVRDPETLAPRPAGERGLVRIDDLANVETAVAVLTSDLGTTDAHGRLVLHGRATGADARGCSIAADALLSRETP